MTLNDFASQHEGFHGAHSDTRGQDMRDMQIAQSSFNLRYITAAIRANYRLIIMLIAGALLVGLAMTMLQTPRYIAKATLQINDTGGRVLKAGGDDGDQDQAVGNDVDRFLKTQVDVIKSRGLAMRVVQKLNLAGDPHFYETEETSKPAAGASLERNLTRASGILMRRVTVTLPRDSRIVTIEYESTDPKMATAIANAYVSEFIESSLQRKFDSSSYARDFLAKQLDSAKARVEDSEKALNAYARSQGLIIARAPGGGDDKQGSGNSVTTSSLFELNTQANQATARRIVAEGRWKSVANSSLMSATEIVSNAAVSGLISQKAQVEAALAEERARHLDSYPTVAGKRAELASLNNQIRISATSVRESIKAEYMAALDSEHQLNDRVKQFKADTLSEQDRSVQYSLLSRETDTNRQVYEGLLERYKQLNAVAGASLSNISAIDAAVTPTSPSSPNIGKNMLIALLVGVTLAVLMVYIKDQFDDSIRVPEDLETKLGLPMMGVIPKSRAGNPIENLNDPKSSISEAYNSLRGSLTYSTPDGLPRVILVTSAQPAEGKSTTAFAIAVTMTRMGKRVLLMDADLRRPSLHRNINYDNALGLSSVLSMQQPLSAVIVKAPNLELSCITSGPIPPSPTELLSSSRMEQLLTDAAEHFDLVIIDSPPVLGLADAPVMSPLADGVLFVVEADRSRRGSLKTALRRLRAMRPVMLGAVLTKFDAAKAGKEYYDYYGYDYYQYTSSEDDA